MSNARINIVLFWVIHFKVYTDWKIGLSLNRFRLNHLRDAWSSFREMPAFEVCEWGPLE